MSDCNNSVTKYFVVQPASSGTTDSYVTGVTINSNVLELGRNQGLSTLSVSLSQFLDNTDRFLTGATMNANILELSRSGGLSNVVVDLSQFTGGTGTDTNYYVTGSSMNGNTLELGRNGGLSTLTTDLSQFLDNVDTFISGTTFNTTTFDLTIRRNDGINFTENLGSLASDIYVMSGDYNPSTGIVTYTTNSGNTFQVSGFTTGMTDSYTTDAYLSGNEIRFDSNINGINYYRVNLNPLLSGKTNNTDFWLHTGDTNNPHQTSFSNLINTGHTHTLNDITDFLPYSGSVQTQIDLLVNQKLDNGINYGGGHEVFSGKSDTDLYFRTLSGGSFTTLTTIGDVIRIDVSGTTGPQGIQGEQGISGNTGAQGIQGISGETGSQGISGNTGAQGISGNTGSQGVQGIQGIQGVQGISGNTGSQGIQGISGATGTQGIQGISGATGSQGIQGISGNTGDQGIQGISGNTGSQGIQGISGDTGSQGIQGTQGISGATGIQGISGATGPAGPITIFERKLFMPASISSDMGSTTLTYHGTTGVAFLAFGGTNPDNDQGSFPMVVPQDYVSGGTFELIYTSQTTANDLVWSFSVTNCATGVDFSTITESGPHMDLVVSGQTFLDRGTSTTTSPTGTTFNVYDAVTVKVNRDASDSRDTANNITGYIYGLIFNYKANN